MKDSKALKFFAYIVTIIFSIIIIYPLLYIATNSMKDSARIYDVPPQLFPNSAQSLAVYVDYSEYADLSDEALIEKMQQDHVIATMSTVANSDMAKESIFEIEFFGMMGDENIYYSRGHRTALDLEKDNGIFKGVFISQKTLTHGDRIDRAIEVFGYDFDRDGLKYKAPESLGENSVETMVQSYLTTEFEMLGEFKGTTLDTNNLLLFESFVHYVKLPSYIYSQNETIAQFSFGVFFFNTFIVIGFAILSQITLCALTAFSLSKLMPKNISKIMLLFFLGSTMIPFVSIMVPQLTMFQNMGLYDNYAAILLPHLLPYGFFIYLYKGFFDNLPSSLFEAGRIDGASNMYLFTNICLPLSKPIISVIALQTFLSNWNDFFWAWLVTERQELWTLNVALYNISKVVSVKQNFVMGLSILTILPVLIITILFSNQIKENIASAGIKG